MQTGSKALWIVGSGGILALLGFAVVELGPASTTPPSSPANSADPVPSQSTPSVCTQRQQYSGLAAPQEQPAQVRCDAARSIVAQARRHLVEPPAPVDPKEFAELVNDWLDPHGLWSAAPDAPVAPLLTKHARRLVAALERGDRGGCETAELIGAKLADWVLELRRVYEGAAAEASKSHPSQAEGWKAASDAAFENGPVQRPARELAEVFGRRAGLISAFFGEDLKPMVERGVARLLPNLKAEEWGHALLAASVRAYVILIDPHGAWAPADEESSLYEVELEASGRTRLWQKMTRTTAGLRIDEASGPLHSSDLVLSIAGIPTAGLSVEQAEQLGILDPKDESPDREIAVLRDNERHPVLVRASPSEQATAEEPASSVTAANYPFADSETIVLKIPDVPDDLGDQMATRLAEARGQKRLTGVVLDLRGNGGGSTDGARAAIGLFLPGVPLFPMRRRDGSIEIEHAMTPTETDRWDGPVAALVDGTTASAAEMIAGALAAYRRGPVIGSRTYGKGCAQEYMDDEVGAGVLRLTTLVYALPDGTPVQRVGLTPTLLLGPSNRSERENVFARSPAPWRAPDMRDRTAIRDIPWPSHAGQVGPCQEDFHCKALRALGSTRSASSRGQRSPSR